MITNKS